MKNSLKGKNDFISSILVLTLICAIYAINEQKVLLYSIKIVFILFMIFRFVVCRCKFTKYSLWSIIFIIFCLASILWATNQDRALYNFIWVLQTLLISTFMETFIDNRRKLDFVMKSFVVGGALLTIRLLIVTPTADWGTKRIGAAIHYNANDVGLKLFFASMCSTYLTKIGDKKFLNGFATVVFIIFALFSGSKKVFLLLVLSIILYNIISVKKPLKFIVLIPAGAILVYSLYYIVMNVEPLYNVLGNRISIMVQTLRGDTMSSGSTYIRKQMMKVGYRLLENKPVFGYGIGNYAVVSGFATYSHNNYIEMLVNLGIIGFLLYYSLYLYLLRKFFIEIKNDNSISSFPFIIVILLMVAEVALVSYYSGYIQILLMVSFSFLRLNRSERTI